MATNHRKTRTIVVTLPDCTEAGAESVRDKIIAHNAAHVPGYNTTTEILDLQEGLRALRRAFGETPYGGLVATQLGTWWEAESFDEQLDLSRRWLANLRDVLLDHSSRNEETEKRLRELESQRDAVRSFLGTKEA